MSTTSGTTTHVIDGIVETTTTHTHSIGYAEGGNASYQVIRMPTYEFPQNTIPPNPYEYILEELKRGGIALFINGQQIRLGTISFDKTQKTADSDPDYVLGVTYNPDHEQNKPKVEAPPVKMSDVKID